MQRVSLTALTSVLALVSLPGCRHRVAPARDAGTAARASRERAPDAGPPRRAPVVARPRPRPRPAPLPVLPTRLQDLPLAKHRAAVYAAPQGAGRPPWPVVVILHGNYDRPEWECEWWLPVRSYGWLLCPRGQRRAGVPRRLDRWTYAGSGLVARELHAGLDALGRRHSGLVSERRAVLIGFSLGAIFGPRVMLGTRLGYRHAVFVEGGTGVDDSLIRQLAKRGLTSVAYLCGQHSSCGPKARKAARRWQRRGVPAKVWIMPGVGHNYSEDFAPLARQVFAWLRSPPAPTKQQPHRPRRAKGAKP